MQVEDPIQIQTEEIQKIKIKRQNFKLNTIKDQRQSLVSSKLSGRKTQDVTFQYH